MTAYPAILLFIVTFLSPLSSVAFGAPPKNCTKPQLISKVCAREIAGSPYTCIGNYNRLDDTGYGKKVTDIVDQNFLNETWKSEEAFHNTPEKLANTLTRVDEAAAKKFGRVYDAVEKAYSKLFAQMPEPDREYYGQRLSQLRKPDHWHLTTSMKEATHLGVDAYYNPKFDSFKIMPLLLNYPGISEVELEMLLAHEFGHALDPNEQKGQKLSRKLNITPDQSCFETRFQNSKNKLYRDEDYADFMASQVASVIIESGSDDANREARATNWAYAFCPADISRSETLSGIARYVNSLSPIDRHEHRDDDSRIVSLMSNPEILNRIGCGPVVTESKTKTKPCSLWQNQNR